MNKLDLWGMGIGVRGYGPITGTQDIPPISRKVGEGLCLTSGLRAGGEGLFLKKWLWAKGRFPGYEGEGR